MATSVSLLQINKQAKDMIAGFDDFNKINCMTCFNVFGKMKIVQFMIFCAEISIILFNDYYHNKEETLTSS